MNDDIQEVEAYSYCRLRITFDNYHNFHKQGCYLLVDMFWHKNWLKDQFQGKTGFIFLFYCPIVALSLRKWGSWHEKKKKIGKKIGELKFAKKKNWQTGKK